MSQNKSFVRKVIYIAIIGALLIPLSLISRPATRDKENAVKNPGGVLSMLRDKHELSLAKLSEIDPGSETMKLASLGLRGLAVNLLWLQAIDAKDKKNWDTFSSTLNSLVKIQPNFIRVWEFQSHNLSYNVSVEFDDYEQRYHWVKKGIEFLTTGIPYNRRDHRIIDSLGFFCGNKFGTADERVQYRSLFRNDDQFHEEMSRYVDIGNIDTPYGPDHWLLAYEWYDRSLRMVETGVDGSPVPKYRKDMLFYQYKPAQLRNMGLSMHSEFRSDEFARSNWERAHREWLEYGRRPITAVEQLDVTLESLTDSLVKVQEYRRRLDEMAPGVRQNLLSEKLATYTPEDRALLDRPIDSLSDEEFDRMRLIDRDLYQGDSGVDIQVLMSVPAADRQKADVIMQNLAEETIKISMGDHFRGTINYEHWKYQTMVEGSDEGLLARQAEFDAMELRGRSIFDEYYSRDPVSSDKKLNPGSIQKFDEAFNSWAGIMEEYPQLRLGPMLDDIVTVIETYMVVREAAGEDALPADFVLQPVIDYRAGIPNTLDELPTSEEVADRLDLRGQGGGRDLPRQPNIEFSLDDDERRD